MIIRRELSDDVAAIRGVIARAFATGDATPTGGEPVEAALVDLLRADSGWIPELSLVAIAEDEVVGHVVCTRAHLDGRPALGLAPLSVDPGRQGVGVGSALMHAVVGAAEALSEPIVALLGDPGYYRRFGFVSASTLGIVAPDAEWGDGFQVRTLTNYDGETGDFAYSGPFSQL